MFVSCGGDEVSFNEPNNENFEQEEPSIDCSDARSSASYGYDYARKAYHSDALEDIQYYAKKAMDEFESALSYASDCGCDDAYYAADEAYSYAKKAYNAYDYEDGENYAKKAMNAGDDIESYANSCENQ